MSVFRDGKRERKVADGGDKEGSCYCTEREKGGKKKIKGKTEALWVLILN
jgi:hypothetical protein